MTKNIRAYFKSENDVESARASLQRLRVSNLFIDELPEEERENNYVAILPLGSASNSTSIGTGVAGANTGAGVGNIGAAFDDGDDNNQITHILEGQVEDEDYEEAQAVLAENRGYTNNS